jgi:DNA-directed RNA polymerase specialized sigma subunit
MTERFIEYERCKTMYGKLQKAFERALLEKERLFTRTLPSAIRYDKDKVQSTVDDNPLEDFVINCEDKELEERIARYRQHLKDWGMLLDIKETELRQSRILLDRVYVCRYLEGLSIKRMCGILNYSRPQVYRKLSQLNKKMRQNETHNEV